MFATEPSAFVHVPGVHVREDTSHKRPERVEQVISPQKHGASFNFVPSSWTQFAADMQRQEYEDEHDAVDVDAVV
jgi:hypothetical protein